MPETAELKLLEKEDILTLLREYKNYFRERFGVREIGLFGSFAKGEQTKNSDIDILIEVEKGRMSLISYMKLKLFLEELLGRKVDLVTKKSLKPELKENVLKDAIYV